jgi:uncharacterized protein Yka (UPF0111/DUF47 family)
VTEKNRIIEALGERKLLMPSLINSGLAANDQIKYLLTLLQVAKVHADHPEAPFSSLQQERIASALDEDELDDAVGGSRRDGGDSYRIPHLQRILELILSALKSMLSPFDTSEHDAEAKELTQRYQRVLLTGFQTCGDLISGSTIARMTTADRDQGDSVHLLVMDLHRALNRLQGEIAAENIDGARAYEIKARDRALIRAFMKGVNETAPLKFDHPGLGTTATNTEGKLVLQNDIGTTDAHVLVVHVTAETVILTYTDVHLQRLLFFESLFERYDVRWDDTVSRRDKTMEEGVYHLCIGRYTARTKGELEEYLAFLGSRLVFLIDWNRARKRLRAFLPRSATIDLLKWAADSDLGHMAFLKLGGEQLVFDAMDFVMTGPRRLGERLDAMLGADQAAQYLRFVLKTASEALRQGQPGALVRDEVKAELLTYFRTARQGSLDTAAEHATLIVDIAAGMRDALLKVMLPRAQADLDANARRAKDWESQADQLVIAARSATDKGEGEAFFRGLLEAADDVADDLEEAAFHFTLLPASGWREQIRAPVLHLANMLVQSAQEYLKALEAARYVHRGGLREDTQDFLEAIHRIATLERRTDEAQRSIKRVLVTDGIGDKELYVYSEAVKNLERSADGLMHSALMLRDYVLGEVMVK